METLETTAALDRFDRLRWIGLAVFLGGIAGLGMFLGVSYYRGQGRLPPLDRAALDVAKQRWADSAPGSYVVEITVNGPQPAVYRVEVQDGEVQVAERNGRALPRGRTFGTWSVPGMFHTIELDMENTRRIAAGEADRQTPQLSLRARFDPRFGYPVRYHRTEKTKWGTNPAASWEVTLFDVGVDSS